MLLSYQTQVRSLPCLVTESLALIFVQNVGFAKVVKWIFKLSHGFVKIDKCIYLTRSYAALRAADLDWIVGPGYSLGRVNSGEKP